MMKLSHVPCVQSILIRCLPGTMLMVLGVAASSAYAYDARLVLPDRAEQSVSREFTLETQTIPDSETYHTPPAVAGLLSAVLPGAGQLVLGQQRGWIYIGLDIASWFAYFALNSAGDQGVRDFQRFALAHWDSTRYVNTSSCGEGLGSVNFDQESAALMDVFENDRDLWYAEIGDQKVYACGWGSQDQRSTYNRRRDHASDLSNTATNMIYVLILNRLVSTIDAARSASTKASERAAFDLNMKLDAFGRPEVIVALNQSLR